MELMESTIPMPSPEDIVWIGDGDFLKISSQFLSYFIHMADLNLIPTSLTLAQGSPAWLTAWFTTSSRPPVMKALTS